MKFTNVKKWLAMLLAVCSILSLVACGKSDKDSAGDDSEKATKVAVVFASSGLGDKSLNDALYDGMKKAEREKRAMALLEIVGLADKADAYPCQLSGGQKQRVAIARALANNPKILLCDEPTSALDSFTTKSILNLLQDINCKLGVTIIIITHEIGVVNAICNKVAIINHGTFVEQGDISTVMVNPASPVTRMLLGMKEE